jgi:hypothetical protein
MGAEFATFDAESTGIRHAMVNVETKSAGHGFVECPLIVYTDLDISLCKLLGSGARRTTHPNVLGQPVAT